MTTPTKHHAPRRKKRPALKPGVADNIAASSDSPANPTVPFMEPDRRRAMISDAAYFLSERRDFCPGHEFEDWLTAEREIDQVLGQSDAGCAT
jgi:hypothetical protein